MNKPKISIIVPIFNGELYLEQCLNSLINQTFKDIEIICVNDGSIDNSMKILENFHEKDPRIKIISQKNLGVSVARNNGINQATGEYILFVDSDDWLDLDVCNELYYNAIDNDSDIVLFNSVNEKENSSIKQLNYFSDNQIENYNNFSFDYKFDKKLLLQSDFSACSKLFKTHFIKEQNLNFQGKLFENINFHVISISKANKISYHPNVFYHFRVSNHLSLNMISNNTKQGFVLFDVIKNVENYLINENLMENFKLEFALFKINQLKIRFEKTPKNYKEEFFKKIREEFMGMEITNNDFEDNKEWVEFYNSIIDSPDFNDFIKNSSLISDEIKAFDLKFNEFNDINKFREFVSTDEIFNDLLSNNFLNIEGYEKIKDSELFDQDFYKENYGVDVDYSLLDYIYRGVSKGFNPNSKFDNDYYLNAYPKIKDLNINPFIYYILYGQYEGKYNFNKRMNPSTINQRTLKHEIKDFNDFGVTEKKRNPPLIVSLTSFNKRINQVYFCIYSLLTQSLKPDYVVLWLAEEEFKNKEKDLPDSLLDLRKNGLIIKWYKENIRSFKKLIPSLQYYPNSLIVTADDDIYYPKDWLKILYEEHQMYPNAIVCHRSREITFEPNGSLSSYNKWNLSVSEQKESFLNFPTCGGGALFPPNSLHGDISNKDLFLKLTPHADDIWFWAMMVLNKTKIKVVKDNIYYIRTVDFSKELKTNEVLWELNSIGGNDIQLKNILDYYPEIIDIISKD